MFFTLQSAVITIDRKKYRLFVCLPARIAIARHHQIVPPGTWCFQYCSYCSWPWANDKDERWMKCPWCHCLWGTGATSARIVAVRRLGHPPSDPQCPPVSKPRMHKSFHLDKQGFRICSFLYEIDVNETYHVFAGFVKDPSLANLSWRARGEGGLLATRSQR